MKAALAIGMAVLGLGGTGAFTARSGELCPPRTQWDRSYGGSGYDYLEALVPMPGGGLVAAGYSDSSIGDRQSAFGASDAWIVRLGANGDLLWERSFGGTFTDRARSIALTADGGFIVAATSHSNESGNKTSPNYGRTDYWLIRLDGDGNKLWEKTFGGSADDEMGAVLQTADGGFLLAGASSSLPGGTKTSTNFSGTMFGTDYWVIRTDASGNKLWERSYGGVDSDYLSSAVAASDGGFLLGGLSYSEANGNKTTDEIGSGDYWIVRIDGSGEVLWQRSYGGPDLDYLQCLSTTADDGFVIGGVSYSGTAPAKASPQFGGGDFWAIRIDGQGGTLWEVSLGGEGYDTLSSIKEIAGGGFVLGGGSSSSPGGNKTSTHSGLADFWAVRLTAAGEKVWEQSYGALSEEYPRSVVQTSDGGFAMGGVSTSRPRSGKTAPLLGSADFWIVRIGAETPGDCDGDGVPDAADQCPETAFGELPNASGCSIAQYCPCNRPWQSPSNYVDCIESNTIPFVAAGVFSEERRQALIALALMADCPPTPQSVVVFGLTNSVIGEALITSGSSGYDQLTVEEAGPQGDDGISMQLGAADSGVFVYPYAGSWGDYSASWFMQGTAYGRMNGQSNALVATIRGTKPGYETYPVGVDLSPLQPESLTIQVWSNGTLVAENTVADSGTVFTVYSSSTLGPRVNPFWRMPDGAVGALLEFTELAEYGWPVAGKIDGPFGEVLGNRIFVRANSPSNVVEFLSRFDVVTGGGMSTFSLLDERPGVFGRAHRVLGPAVLEPSVGRLRLVTTASEVYPQSFGTMIEASNDQHLNLGLQPVALTNADAGLQFTVNSPSGSEYDTSASFQLTTVSNTMAVFVYAVNTSTESSISLRVYRHGVLQGVVPVTNGYSSGTIAVEDTNDWPRLIGCGGGYDVRRRVTTGSFSFDRPVAFTGDDGIERVGDYFKIVATNAVTIGTNISSAVITVHRVPSFVIRSEDNSDRPPALAIARAEAGFILSWPARNLPVVLESSAELPGPYARVEAGVAYHEGVHRVSVPSVDTGNRFFRLRLAE